MTKAERDLVKQFERTGETLRSGEQTVDEAFNSLINSVLEPIAQIENLDVLNVNKINASLGELGREGIQRSVELLGEICKRRGVSKVSIQTWIGPQGVGKGSISDTLTYAQELFHGDESEVVFEALRSRGASEEIIEQIRAHKEKLQVKKGDKLDRVIGYITPEADTIKTGTGGIFNPKGDRRYTPYEAQKKVTGRIVSEGAMVSDNWTNFLVTLEVARSVAKGHNTVSVDVWPGIPKQATFLHEDLMPRLQEEGVTLDHN